MFSVYGVTGQEFSGTREEMIRVRALAKARSIRAVAQEGDELGGDSTAGVANRLNEEAVRTYLTMLPHDLERGPLYHANQIMQHHVITVLGNDDVAQAWRVLRDNQIHQAPVLDKMQLIGIVSERDLLTAINIDGGRIVESLNLRVRNVMTTPVVAAAPVTDIRRIAAVMLDHNVDGVPIINDSGRLNGFISRSDILRVVVTDPPLSLWR
ncbi:MAG: CBS domain-containing protein [Desulfuromonadaceae bacterium]|nr:CBS domain-containing protein [Desulfuromonadaceae bacterium]MDD5106689.1 CBS domain-containing protein [Desulfuromonadaceae bacterium]